MSVRRDTKNRLTLIRKCHICGKTFTTTADTPFIRQMYNVDGKKQKTVYFCSEKCKRASYKYSGWWDGKTEERKRERDAARDTREKNRKYYLAHAEQERARAKARYWSDPERARADMKYQREKRRLAV